jgi:hypothetical protein
VSDEFDDLLEEETPPEPLQASDPSELTLPPSPNRWPEEQIHEVVAGAELPDLSQVARARDLLPSELEEDVSVGGYYKGFTVVPEPDTPPSAHSAYPRRFYVESPSRLVGLVPWPGSQIIWPWERGWAADMNRVEVHSALKDEPSKKKK